MQPLGSSLQGEEDPLLGFLHRRGPPRRAMSAILLGPTNIATQQPLVSTTRVADQSFFPLFLNILLFEEPHFMFCLCEFFPFYVLCVILLDKWLPCDCVHYLLFEVVSSDGFCRPLTQVFNRCLSFSLCLH